MQLLEKLQKAGLIHPPNFLVSDTVYLVIMGSVAYGVSSDNSDMDIYGFCIPKRSMVFPHLAGEILGFGTQQKRFDVWQQHHVIDKSAGKEYDFAIYNIVRYFQLCMECNPNMCDSLFVPRRCVIHTTQIGELVRENRKLFLHKGAFQKFKGYAFAQLHKAKTKVPKEGSNREEDYKQHGFSTKFVYHLVRLLDEIEQILVEQDLDLERNREQLKSIRRGEWKLEQADKYFADKERQLEELYVKSTLRERPEEAKIKELLLNCLEMHYGSLEECIKVQSNIEQDMKQILDIASKYR